MGFKSLAKDLGVEVGIKIWTDASAAIGICKRRGLGKIRHLETADLWIQDKVKTTEIHLGKVDGKLNPADMLTKHISGPEIITNLSRLQVIPEEGRASIAPHIGKR